MSWRCGAIENSVVFSPDGAIRPCCFIDSSYKKDITEIFNDPFADLRTGTAPDVCHQCTNLEKNNIESYRSSFKLFDDRKYRYLDIRNFNSCNMKCRTCGPNNSSLWGQELGYKDFLKKQEINSYLEKLTSDDIIKIYYTGGEPLLNPDHWKLLELLIDKGYSKNIILEYNTNGTIVKYKDKDIIDIWNQFKEVSLMVSIDAVGEEFNILRHGGDWKEVKDNLLTMQSWPVNLSIAVTVSLLNIWFLENIFTELKGFKIRLHEATSPPYLCLPAIDERYKEQALECLNKIKEYITEPNFQYLSSRLIDNHDCQIFKEAVLHVLMLDKKRNENLFDRLPFKDYSIIDV